MQTVTCLAWRCLHERLPMAQTPRLPRSIWEWLLLFGPGAIIASLTIGTGELISPPAAARCSAITSCLCSSSSLLMKWALVISTSRHMILTGVHPYERMIDLPGPRGWLPIVLLLMAVVCMPIWISFHSGVLGNLTSWVTGTRHCFTAASTTVWGAAFCWRR